MILKRFLVLILLIWSTQAIALPFRGSEIVVSAANSYATDVGQKIATLGGNPVDVAVATVITMSVTNPNFAALGGGGFALIRMGKKVDVLDFRERAPEATNPDYYKNKAKNASTDGGTAVAVPGLPAGLWEMHKKYGKVHWSRLFDEAIKLANSGFRLSGDLYDDFNNNHNRLNVNARQTFLKDGSVLRKPGELIKQPALAKALSEMRNRNIVSFYNGPIARDIVETVKKEGGDLTLRDLENYKVVWREPITTTFNGYKLYLMPPPSSGGIVIKTALHLIEKLKVMEQPNLGVNEFHLLAEILKRSFSGRTLIADPDFYKLSLEKLLGEKYLNNLASSVKLAAATDVMPLDENHFNESTETTHLSVIDKYGNAVAMTFTLNGDFGSGVYTKKYGIMLNNEMDDFTTRPGEPNQFGLVQGQGNTISPGKRPLSSMSPTLVEKDGKIVMALGAPGGPRIISSVLQVLYRTLGRGKDLQAAVEAPRLHHQTLPNKLFIDENRFSHESLEGLKEKKHTAEESWQARVFAVRNNNGILEAVVDTRGEGATAGY